jgi:regulator of protease activity HflC (stomatin/prohibitin superfamily)
MEKNVLKIAGGILIFFLFISSFYTVGAGKVGVKFNILTGMTSSNSQGFHFKFPIIEKITKFDVRTQREDIKMEASSKDLQIVNVVACLNYRLDYDNVNKLYNNVGKYFVEYIIQPAGFETIKAIISQYPVEEIILKRIEIKKLIEEELGKKLLRYNIILENVNLANIDFTSEFNKIIEEKQIEEQKIKKVQYQKMQAMEYKQKTILEAEAEAEKQRLLKQSVSQEVIALKWIEKWDGKLPSTMLGDKNSTIMVTPKDKN